MDVEEDVEAGRAFGIWNDHLCDSKCLYWEGISSIGEQRPGYEYFGVLQEVYER